MKWKALLYFFFLFKSNATFSQSGQWAWVHGDTVANVAGRFGFKGIADPSNNPPGVYEAYNWTDRNGNVWIYGGYNTATSLRADMWMYNPYSNTWTWMQGDSTSNVIAVYGTLGVPSPLNTPGSRNTGISWVDTSGNFWLYGGFLNALQFSADLWKFNTVTLEWTWMSGSQNTATGGTLVPGIPSSVNYPPSVVESSTGWIDSQNQLWIYGGMYSNTCCPYDRVLRYSISTNEWTWIRGSQFSQAPTVWGTMGIPAATNNPGGRSVYAHWEDQFGNFWFANGFAYADTWRFNPFTSEWTWMSGSNVANYMGNYISYCDTGSGNYHSHTEENKACYKDRNNQVWQFGGTSAVNNDNFNDLWIFDYLSLKYKWMHGTNLFNQPAVFGQQGIPANANIPHSRDGAILFGDSFCHVYLFGGMSRHPGQATYNDVWKFYPDTSCSACLQNIPVASFNSPHQVCPGTCINFSSTSQNANLYTWIFPGANPSTSTDINPQAICYNAPGSYDVTLIASNANGSDTLILSNYITVFQYPAAQGITQSGDTLFANTGAVSYQWYYNGNLLNGATGYFYEAIVSGDYNVVATDSNDCEVEAVIYNVIAGLRPAMDFGQFVISPNPVEDQFTIHSRWLSGSQFTIGTAIEISIYNMLGVRIFFYNSVTPIDVDCRFFPPGMYWIEINSSGKIMRAKVMKSDY
ncbi:MAG: kelch repeat-containing protein [Bacteroidota bacterium]